MTWTMCIGESNLGDNLSRLFCFSAQSLSFGAFEGSAMALANLLLYLSADLMQSGEQGWVVTVGDRHLQGLTGSVQLTQCGEDLGMSDAYLGGRLLGDGLFSQRGSDGQHLMA